MNKVSWVDCATVGLGVVFGIGLVSALLNYFYFDTTRTQKVYCGLVVIAWIIITVAIRCLT